MVGSTASRVALYATSCAEASARCTDWTQVDAASYLDAPADGQGEGEGEGSSEGSGAGERHFASCLTPLTVRCLCLSDSCFYHYRHIQRQCFDVSVCVAHNAVFQGRKQHGCQRHRHLKRQRFSVSFCRSNCSVL